MVSADIYPIPLHIHPATLLDYAQVCALTGKCERSVRKDASQGRFPPPVRSGPKFTRFRAGDVLAWAADPNSWIEAHLATQRSACAVIA